MNYPCPVKGCNKERKEIEPPRESTSSHYSYCKKHLADWFYLMNIERKQISIEQFIRGYGTDGNDVLKGML